MKCYNRNCNKLGMNNVCYYNCFKLDCCNCLSKKNKILNICANQYDYFLKKANVVGVALGYKVARGICTFSECIKVFVSQKIPSNDIPQEDLIPQIYNEIETDVVESGRFTIQSLKGKIRPVVGGCGIRPANELGVGTMACLVTDSVSKYILSCNHVIANMNKLPLQTPILQPAPEHGGKKPQDIIATLYKYIPLKFDKKENFVDCAIAKIVNPSIISPMIYKIGKIKGETIPKIGEYVEKVGCATELTKGTITAIGATMEIDFEYETLLFVNQIITTKMGEAGDSGSLLLNTKGKALGLICGGSNSYNVTNLLGNVLNELGVELVEK